MADLANASFVSPGDAGRYAALAWDYAVMAGEID